MHKALEYTRLTLQAEDLKAVAESISQKLKEIRSGE